MDPVAKSEKDNSKFRNLVEKAGYTPFTEDEIEKRRLGWEGKPGMCEICGLWKATENLERNFGSHKECFSCWTD